ncbi:hypothetical protein ACN20G_26405 (plasmid) [Streptomyces sp. BI20]|uniref:hypothetical protein n=1 Tax=Streptomyces sp. BI20 TaxID=3403460 RepID=UPI003C70F4F4
MADEWEIERAIRRARGEYVDDGGCLRFLFGVAIWMVLLHLVFDMPWPWDWAWVKAALADL